MNSSEDVDFILSDSSRRTNKAPRATFCQFTWSYIHRKSNVWQLHGTIPHLMTCNHHALKTKEKECGSAVGGGGSALRDNPKRRLRRRLAEQW